MSKTGKPRPNAEDDYDATEIFADPDLDPESFVDSMEERQKRSRASWRRLEELEESKWLRAQLQDWEDWDTSNDAH